MKMDDKNLRFPGDLVYSLWIPPTDENENIVQHSDDRNGGDNVKFNHQLCLASTVPAFINFPIDTTFESLASDIKHGYDGNVSKLVPLTCLESGETKSVPLNSYKTLLADRYLSTNSWVRRGDIKGQIKRINASFDLLIRNSTFVIQNVPDSEIVPHPEYYPGQYVYLGGWIGCVRYTRRGIRAQYEKGYECQIFERDYDEDCDAEEDSFPRPDFQSLHEGDTISPTARDIKHAEWIVRPSWIDWIFLRWFNWGYTVSNSAKVIENKLDSVLVEWYLPPNLEPNAPVPFRRIRGSDLDSLLKLDLNLLWYGVKGNYKIKEQDKILTLKEWEMSMSEELGYSIVNREELFCTEKVEIIREVSNTDKSKFHRGVSIVGEIITRRAAAKVVWEDGHISDVPVKELIPYYPDVTYNIPFTPGEVVLKRISGSPLKILYGMIQKCTPGLCVVKWFGTESPEKIPFGVKTWDNTEAVESLYLCAEYKFPIGLIVFSKGTNMPGVVVGNSLSGHVSVKFGNNIRKLFGYELYKFEKIAYSIGYGCDIIWKPLDHSYYLNHKHVGLSFGNIFNITPPASALHSIPEVKYFNIIKNAPKAHHFYELGMAKPSDPDDYKGFDEIWMKEKSLLESSKTQGIWIKAFEDRHDLISVLMTGLNGSLYEGAVFQFDVLLPPKYPLESPLVRFVPNYEYDRLMLNKCHLSWMDDEGILNLEDIWSPNREGDFSNIWLCLAAIQYELFGVTMLKQDDDSTFGMIKKMALSSYTGEIEEGIQNQLILMNIVNSILTWLISPPKLWQNEVLKYWRLELPLFISRVKKLTRLCQENSESEDFKIEAGKYNLLVQTLKPPDSILLTEIGSSLRDLSSAYSKLY